MVFKFERKQVVLSQGKLSAKKELSVGVPQGGVLAPILFLLFINDISQSITSGVITIYADDVIIYETVKDVQSITSKSNQIWILLMNGTNKTI